MNRESFLRELAFLLSDLEEDEREEALQYYKDYFDEVGSEHEAEILVHIGSPEKVAAELKNSLRGGGEGGEYTEREQNIKDNDCVILLRMDTFATAQQAKAEAEAREQENAAKL